MKYLLLLVLFLPGCEEKNSDLITKDECIAQTKQALKELSKHNLDECMRQVKATIKKVQAVTGKGCIKVRPKAGGLTVRSFKTSKLKCFCGNTRYRYDDPKCLVKGCHLDTVTQMSINNGNVPSGRMLHVECIYYNMAHKENYLLRQQEYVKAASGAHTAHTLKSEIHINHQLYKGDAVGVNCFVLNYTSPPVSAVANVSEAIDTKYDK